MKNKKFKSRHKVPLSDFLSGDEVDRKVRYSLTWEKLALRIPDEGECLKYCKALLAKFGG